MISVARKPRKLEQQLRAKIILILPDCKVCGKRMDGKFLRPFPGAPDIKACPICITEGTVDVNVYSH
ncbi:hypothetical protein [Cohnella abietis]|uniref:Uncharacterized protein n=1 Tax=Cohnella abietis TaxID=2507935 RepID=A0A3T1D2S4_9BACL|nr:hypothetical protein [Cohnella abietis]BBI32341.1 hypothetical protein KCTCHS21_17400 [Cohnella abietis]